MRRAGVDDALTWPAGRLAARGQLAQDLDLQWFQLIVVDGIEYLWAVRDGHDLRHERSQDHVVPRAAFGLADLPAAVGLVGYGHEHVEARVRVEAPTVEPE